MHFNLLDLLLLVAFGAAVADGLRRGFGPYASELLAFGLSLGVAFVLFRPIAAFLHGGLEVPGGLASLGSFLMVLVASHALTLGTMQRVTGRVAGRLRGWMHPDAFRAVGAIPALGTALILAAVILSALVVLPQAGSRGLVLGSALGSTITRDAAFMQRPLQAMLLPAAQDGQAVIGQSPPPDAGDQAFYRLHFPADLETALDLNGEAKMLGAINRVREDAHLSPLMQEPSLQSAARAHSLDMYKRAYFSHQTPEGQNPFDRMHAVRVPYVTAGENIAYAPDADQAMESLMKSPDHRANILNPEFRCVGIGIYKGLGGFEEMVTQDFADCQ